MLDRLVARAATVVTHTEPPRLFAEIGRHPRLFRWWLPFAGALLVRSELQRADTEVVILRTAWNCRCRYEWVQHASLAERAGLDRQRIAAVADGETAKVWTDHQRALLRATDELHEDRRVHPATVRWLERSLGERQLLELCMLVGHYEMLAMVLQTRNVEPEPSALARLHGRVADLADDCRVG